MKTFARPALASLFFSGIRPVLLAAAALGLAVLSGCTMPPASPPVAGSDQPPPQMLQAGDVVKLSFPGAPTMDTTQQIRQDGKLNLVLLGEVEAAGKTPAELEQTLTTAYASQLVSKEVKLTVMQSAFTIYVTGAVMQPGRIQPLRMLTAFEAIMEAGGFNYAKAKTTDVRVIRTVGNQTQSYSLDLKAVLAGKATKPFYLRSGDTIYVPEKVELF